MESINPSTTEDTDSPSSLTAEATMSDPQEQLAINENTETDKKAEEERKLRRLNRRKALALERSPLPPKLGGSVLTAANNTIDLTNEDDDPSNRWFKKTFNAEIIKKVAKSPEDTKLFAVPRTIPKNAPKSLIVRETLKKKLQASMSAKRKKAQEQRRKMYEEDNEHLKADSDEEEEEEEIIFKKKTTKKPQNDDYDSEDDEDYNPDNDSDNEEKNDGNGGRRVADDDEMSVNLLNDSFTYDVFNNVKRSGPGSTVSSYDSRSQADYVEKNGQINVPTMSQFFGGGGGEGSDDILKFCSGKFEAIDSGNGGFPDTLQMLLDEAKTEKKQVQPHQDPLLPQEPSTTSEKPSADSEDDDEDDAPMKKKTTTKKANRVLDSDEEDGDDDVTESPEGLKSQDVFGSVEVEESQEINTTEIKLTRVVLSGDEDSEEEEAEDVEEEDSEGEEEEEEDVEEEEEPEAPVPNFDDEDDELAVIKRLEHQEYTKQMKKRTLFDDEASLSGDDVGSDLEDEEGILNEYEAEEGDADNVPDDETIRRQNYKLMLKQDNDKEMRALAKLQDRLLADGDLGGLETNRQFRFKLREDVEVHIGGDGDGNMDDQEDDEPEEDEQKKKERAEMIKFRIQHAEELLHLDDSKEEEDDMFTRAGKLMKKTEKTAVIETTTSEETIHKNLKIGGKPSLLSKTTLAVSFQEVLNGGGGVAKQMYVQNFDKTTTTMMSSGGATSSRLSSGAVKRGLKSPDKSMAAAAKRVRSSKLSALE